MIAGNANVYVMRQAELQKGITVKDEKTGQEFGSSKIAANEAIWRTMYSRAAGCFPMFFVAPAYNFALKSMNLLPKPKTPLGYAAELGGIAIGLWMT